MTASFRLQVAFILVPCLLAACGTPSSAPGNAAASTMTLTSTAFADGAAMSDKYTYTLSGQCNGENISPPLSWTGVPSGTHSFALVMVDPDAGGWVHWVLFNLPADVVNLPEVAGGPGTGIKGKNGFGELGYGGPCPPSGTHRYLLTLYALDSTLPLSEGATKGEVDTAMAGHILAQAQLTGLRSRE